MNKSNQILTEEELKLVSRKYGAMLNAKRIDFEEYEMFEDVIVSHNQLIRANAELSFKNMELNRRIKRTLDYSQPIGYEDYIAWVSIMRSILSKPLEELK